MRFRFCPYLTLLIIIFSLFFIHTLFILNEDHLLIAAYEAGDPGNLAYAIMSLFDYPIYSHHNYFFLSTYGWVFADISFVLIFLLKVLGQILGFYDQPLLGLIDDQALFNGIMRAVNFTFALLSVLLFFKLSNLLFNNKKVSFIASLFFMFLPWAAIYSYWLHPDATGMFFLLLSIWYLVKFVKQEPKLIYFYLSFVSLVLTTLSKYYHGFFLFPIFLIFLFNYCDRENLKYSTCLFSKNFIKVLISLPFVYLFILLIIHPYSIFDFEGGVYKTSWMLRPWEFFLNLFKSSAGEAKPTNVPFLKSFYNWMILYQKEPLIYINTLLFYLLIIPLFFRKKFTVSWLFVTSVIFCHLYLWIVTYGNRTHFELRYIYPIAPLLILNLVAFTLYVWSKLNSLVKNNYQLLYLKFIFASIGILYFLPILAENVLVITNSLLARSAYQHSTLYQARKFMLNNIKTFSQRNILFDIGTAPVPPQFSWVVPHASISWAPSNLLKQEGFSDYLNPKALITWVSWESSDYSLEFIKNTPLQFIILIERRQDYYRHYMKKNRFKLIKTFQASEEELVWFSYWFPYVNNRFKTIQTTKKLLEVHRNPDLVIGPTIVVYGRN